ncbi:MAG: hypothetical protein ACYDAR_09560 [Thermomicrobiales bacterium]
MNSVTRRTAMKIALKGGAYAVPVILAAAPISVAAALPSGPPIGGITSGQVIFTPCFDPIVPGNSATQYQVFQLMVAGVGGAASFDVYLTVSPTTPLGATLMMPGTLDTDAAGMGSFSGFVRIQGFVSPTVTSSTVTLVLHGAPANPPRYQRAFVPQFLPCVI